MSDVDKSEHDPGDSLSPLDEDSEHGIGLLTGQQQHFAGSGSKLTCYLTYAAIAVLCFLSLVSAVSLSSRGCSKHGFAAGFDTDLVEKIKFTGGFEYDENGTLYRTFEPGETQYVGDPNPEIDAAWEALVEVDGVDLMGDEATSVVGTTFQKPGSAWLVGVDGFHQLHCINMMYRSLYPDYYPPKHSPDFHRIHMEHCIDYLRQSVMCSLDITPIKVE
ncbi:hypothetical protein LA080_000700 [Diaporthe eres]|nr:hypothetical protein LA080_000700 [Diaporthe eres]